MVKKAKVKFDFHLDFLQLGSQFMLAKEIKDYPFMKAEIKHTDWQDYFTNEAKNLKNKIIN